MPPKKSTRSRRPVNTWLSVLKRQEHPQLTELVDVKASERELPEWSDNEERIHFWSQVDANFKYHLNRLFPPQDESDTQPGTSAGADSASARKKVEEEALQFITAAADAIKYDVARDDEYSSSTPPPLIHMVTIMEGLLSNNEFKYQVKCHISKMLDAWCSKQLIMSESLIKTAFICHLKRALELPKSKADVARVWNFHQGLFLSLEGQERLDPAITRMLFQAVKCHAFLVTKEGRNFIAYAMSLCTTIAEGIHLVMMKQMDSCKVAVAQQYGEIYFTAWHGAPDEVKEVIEHQFRNYMHYFFRFRRKGISLSPLGANVFAIARCFHAQRNNRATKKMLASVYETLLWMYVQDGINNNRCNAAQVLFDAYPIEKPGSGREENSLLLEKQHQTMTKFLLDPCHLIRIIAIRQLCAIMCEYWQSIPMNTLKEWITIMVRDLANDAADMEVRRSVFRSLPKLLGNPHAEEYMKGIFPMLEKNFHDVNQNVRSAFADMLLEFKKTTIRYWDVAPMKHILARLGIEDRDVGTKLVNLIFESYISPHYDPASTLSRVSNMIFMNLDGARNFFMYSDELLDARQAMDLVILIFPVVIKHVKDMVEQERRNLETALSPVPEGGHQGRPRRRRLYQGKENARQGESSDSEPDASAEVQEEQENIHTRKDCHNPVIAQGYIDIVATLLMKHDSSFSEPEYGDDLKKIHKMCALGIPLFLRYYKATRVYSSVLYLCSATPLAVLKKVTNVESTLLSQLKQLTLDSTRADIIMRVQPLCSWGHATDILEIVQDWLNEAFRTEDLNSSFNEQPTSSRKKVNFKRCQVIKPRVGLRILTTMLDHSMTQMKLLKKNYSQLVALWYFMSKVRTLIEERMTTGRPFEDPLLNDEFLQECYKEYLLLIPTLDGRQRKNDVKVDSVKEFTFVLKWADVHLLKGLPAEPPGDPHRSSSVGVSPFTRSPLAIHLIKSVLEVLGDMHMLGLSNPKFACDAGVFCLSVLNTGCGMMFVHPVSKFYSRFLVYVRHYEIHDDLLLFRSVTITNVIEILNTLGKMRYDQSTAERLLESVTDLKRFLLKILSMSKLYSKSRQGFLHHLAHGYVINLLKILKHEFSELQVVDVLRKTKDLPFLAQQLAEVLVKDVAFRSIFLKAFGAYFSANDLSENPLMLLAGFSLLHWLAVDPQMKLDKNILKPVLQSLMKCLEKYREHLKRQEAAQDRGRPSGPRRSLRIAARRSSQDVTIRLDVAKEVETVKKACRAELLGNDCLELWEVDEMISRQFGEVD